jgi:DNA-binding response OmpR family regulator
VVALDEDATPRERAMALHAGADHTVRSKPAIVQDLAAIVQAVLSGRPKSRSCEFAPEA